MRTGPILLSLMLAAAATATAHVLWSDPLLDLYTFGLGLLAGGVITIRLCKDCLLESALLIFIAGIAVSLTCFWQGLTVGRIYLWAIFTTAVYAFGLYVALRYFR
ncbi:MAG: hypothetical protein DRJ67_01410 [Thermoprotei archaeon]|nr:MAG: hypothetical protein DRJ67_01410 [Thermoprotei archaeon]